MSKLVLQATVRKLVFSPVAGPKITLTAQVAPRIVFQAAGVQGPPGPAGTVPRHRHDQVAASSAWTINHNLGSIPLVQVFSTGGVEVQADVIHLSANQAQINFNSPQTGFVIAS